MTDETLESGSIPVNEEGAIVVHLGGGTQSVVGFLPSGCFPIDSTSNGLVLRLPSSVVDGDMSTLVYDPNDDGKIDFAQTTGVEPTLTKGNLSGTTNQVSVVGGTGAVIGSGVTLSLPQNIDQAASPIFNAVKIDPTPSSIPSDIGAVFYDEEYKTLATNTGVPGVVLQIGQETHLLCINNTGSQLLAGTIVYINGSTGEHPTVAKAVNTDYNQAHGVMGMLTSSPLNGEHCMVTVHGLVHDLNTAAYSPGTMLYLDSIAGGFTSTKPTTEKSAIRVGYVVKQNATTGEVFIDKQTEMNSSGASVDAQVRTASVAIPTTPTLFVWDTEINDSLGIYDPLTGEYLIPFDGNYTFVFLYNAATSGVAKQLYSAAQVWNGSSWVALEYSTRQLYIAQNVKNVATFISTNPFTAGTRLRFVTWASASGVTIVTESPAAGYTIPAARVMITAIKTI